MSVSPRSVTPVIGAPTHGAGAELPQVGVGAGDPAAISNLETVLGALLNSLNNQPRSTTAGGVNSRSLHPIHWIKKEALESV